MYMLIRHKVRDFSEWRQIYDSGIPKRTQAGLTEKYLLRSDEDPNEVIILYETGDIDRAKNFSRSPDLRERMEKAGVIDRADVYFLNDASGASARTSGSMAERDEIEELKRAEGVVTDRPDKEVEIEFVYLAPQAGRVNLAGSFNNWDPKSLPMKKNKRGQWKAIVRLVPGRYEYRYIADGSLVIDKHCAEVVADKTGAPKCVIDVAPRMAA